jgi:hypothetical protein
MKITVDLSMFRREFRAMNRNEQFTYEGLEVLFDYLEELEFCEEESELDVIGLCCDFAEGEPLDIANDYSIDLGDEAVDPDNVFAIVREYLDNEGVLIGETDNTIIYRQF